MSGIHVSNILQDFGAHVVVRLIFTYGFILSIELLEHNIIKVVCLKYSVDMILTDIEL